jgi:hypothetical protein
VRGEWRVVGGTSTKKEPRAAGSSWRAAGRRGLVEVVAAATDPAIPCDLVLFYILLSICQ